MKKATIGLLTITAGVLTLSAGAAVGFTVAGYNNSKNYIFNSSVASSERMTVRDIAHYFADGTQYLNGNESTGAAAYPFFISSPTHLRNLAKLWNMGAITNGYYFKLANSFNWSGDPMEPIGTSTKSWQGFFNGNCHTITGLEVEATGAYAGMFGVIGGNTAGRVVDLCLSSPTIDCKPSSATNVTVGFLAGKVNCTEAVKAVSGIMIYGGNENSVDGATPTPNELVKRATIKANSYATVTSSADRADSSDYLNSLIVGDVGYRENNEKLSFVSHMGDIVVSDGHFANPSAGQSGQSSLRINGVSGSFTYKYYRKTNGDMYKVP